MPKPQFTYKGTSDSLRWIKDVQGIYDRMVDQQSKEIFLNRLLYSCTGDWLSMKKVVQTANTYLSFMKDLSESGEIYIYGAGLRGTRLIQLFMDVAWTGFIDQNKSGEEKGIPIYPPSKLKCIPHDAVVVISNGFGVDDIRAGLRQAGVEESRIIALEDYNDKDNIYFDDSLGIYNDIKGCFVDGGAFDGFDSKRFLERVRTDDMQKVIAIEPDLGNYEKCKKRLLGYENCDVIHAGLSDKSTNMRFQGGRGMSSSFSEQGDQVPVLAMDAWINEDARVGMIKMDIEGFEEKALKGCKKIIAKQKPLLAISVYHKRQDFFDIPMQILRYNNEYRFYIRHYSVATHDTVLYAV